MLPTKTLDVAQVYIAQTKALGPVVIGQPYQPICDLILLAIELEPVAIAGLTGPTPSTKVWRRDSYVNPP